MKKVLSILISLVICMSCFSVTSFAANDKCITVASVSGDTVYYSDGSYIVTTIVEEGNSAKSTTKNLTKYISYFNDNGIEQCRLTLNATFVIVTGTRVTCTSSTYTTQIFVKGWSIDSPSATRANYSTYATATASGIAKKKILGIINKNIPLSTTITCYDNGSYA